MTSHGAAGGAAAPHLGQHYGPGLHQLPHTSGRGLCNITATASGAGHLTVEILKAG